ncbi:T9SS type B sorting domain-containing protein [Crocinitomix catalasitica]|uniref:T9SS type B sorting domain-containing protein n=1 Tax=Crocinitomix catalasitica TaxID=184607 RepID=UPI00047FA892|nr:gliding motility-associated C-terminal domain-containing protein [Crocinitomix catalasitica]
MHRTKQILFSFLLIISSSWSLFGRTFVITSVADTGPNTLREAVSMLADNDSIIFNVKGTIRLTSTINIDNLDNVTIIGPYPKHLTIAPNSSYDGDLLRIQNCTNLKLSGVGFVGADGATRLLSLVNCPTNIVIEHCLFEDNDLTSTSKTGAAALVQSSNCYFYSCSFINNRALIAGGIYFTGSRSSEVINCTFSNNYASDYSAAVQLQGNASVRFYNNTFFQNNANNFPEVMGSSGGTAVYFENNAFGDNGTNNQVSFSGTTISYGGNRFRANYALEFLTFPILAGDNFSLGLNLGFRDQILEDGFGLKYWPIIDPASALINTKAPNVRTPDFDCRRAPRALKGPSAFLVYPDAGAVEYTHLRVTNDGGDEATANSLLWALSDAERKDEMHYIEFDLPDLISDIDLSETAILDSDGYIIDGYSQYSSSIPGPPLPGDFELTPAIIAINLENGSGVTNCFEITADSEGSIIQGFRIMKFDNSAIYNDGNNTKIFGNEIGISSLNVANGNASSGITSQNADGVIIGGMEHYQRNVISGNGSDDLRDKSNIFLKSGRAIEVYGNIIGVANDGINEISGGSLTPYGLLVKSDANSIGSHLTNGGNIIGKNDYGIYLQDSDSSKIYNNCIGVALDLIGEIDNTNAGILLEDANRNIIGNIENGYGNHIANNGSGINVGAEGGLSQYNSFYRNSIYNNNAQGIDLKGDGLVLPNDSSLNITGQNHEIDFPQLIYSVSCDAEDTKTGYQLNLPVGSDCRVEFFTIDSPDATNGEGKTFIGFQNVTLVSTPEQFEFDHGEVIPVSTSITATVTRINSGNTSEFGNNLLVEGSGDPSFSMDDFCPDSLGRAVILGDDGYFSFTSPFPADGATLDSLTGVLTGGVQGNSYEIFRNVNECNNNDTLIVTVIDLDPSFVYPDFCPGTIGLPSSITEPGGTFTFRDDPADGATLNASTGAITDGVEGTTYYVIYDLLQCAFRDTVAVTVIPTDERFTVSDFCIPDSEVPVTETLGGSFQFAPDPADGASIDAATGQITNAVEGNTYYIEYEVGVCAEVDTVEVATIFTDERFSFDDICPGLSGTPVIIGEAGGVFSFETDPLDGAAIDASTGELTDGVEGNSYDIIYTVGVCDDKDTVTVTITPTDESFEFDDFCIATNGYPSVIATPGGEFELAPDIGDGASIDISSGELTNAVEGTSYTIQYTVGTCSERDSVTAFAIEADERFSYADFCEGTTGTPVIIGDAGGIFSFLPPAPADGEVLVPDSGELTGAIEGTDYTIIYTVGVCDDKDTVTFSIIETDERFSFADFCPETDGTPTIIGEAGGVFSFQSPVPLDGASIDDATGTISDGVEGTIYNVIYTVGTCDDKDTVAVQVIPTDESFTFDDFCEADSGFPTVIATPGGVFNFAPDPVDGAILDMATGELSGTTEGSSYTIEYTVGVCSERDSVTVSIIETDESFSMSDFCPGTNGIAVIEGDAGGTFSFLPPDPLDGATLNPTTGLLSDAIEGETYTIIYTVGACNDKDTVEVHVLPTDESFSFDDLCPGDTGLPYDIASPGGIFSLAPDLGDGALLDPITGEFTEGVEGSTYTIQYLVGACYEIDSVSITVEATDEAFSLADFCAETSDAAVPNTPGGTYRFAPDLFDGSLIDPSTGVITNAIEGAAYQVEYAVGSCGEVDTVFVNVIETDESFEFDDFCPGTDGIPVITGDEGGVFSFLLPAPIDGASIDPTTGIVSDGVESTTYTIIYTVGVCGDADTNSALVINIDESFNFEDICPGTIGTPSDIVTPGGAFYLSPDPLDGVEIDLLTGELTNTVEGSTYNIEYVVGLCSESSTQDVFVITIDESFSLDDFCASTSLPATAASPGGTFTFAPDLLDGALIDPTSGLITNGIEGTAYAVEYEVGICNEVDTVLVNVIETDESFIFDDFCPGTDGVPVLTGDLGGDFSFLPPLPGDGASIDPISGVVSDGVEGTSYSIIYHVGVCDDRDTMTAIVIPTDESFTFEDFCPNTVGAPFDVMTPDGLFYLAPDLLDGASIDDETGELSNTVEGTTYAIAYMVGACLEEDTVLVHIIETDESFSIPEFCPNTDSEIAVTASPGGTFAFAPDLLDGASIDALTGQIFDGKEGTIYPIEYTVGVCAEQDTILVSVISTDESFNFENFCAEFIGIPTDIGTEGGSFSFAPDLMDGALIDPITGYISDAVPGTSYTIEYTVGICSERDTMNTLAMISEIADFDFDNFCAGDENNAEVTGTAGGIFEFNPTPLDDAIIDELTGTITNTNGNAYTVRYITPGTELTCKDTISKIVTAFALPIINEVKSTQYLYCPQDELLTMEADITADDATVYWRKYSELDPILDSGIFYIPTLLDVGENNYFIQVKDINGCQSTFSDITILLSDTAGMRAGDDIQVCLGKSAELAAYGGVSYSWENSGGIYNIVSDRPSVFTLQEHDYMVEITNEDNCVVYDTLHLGFSPQNECTIYVVNAFSPNGDGTNDTWYIENLINYLPNTVMIFNRWGDKILEFDNYDNINTIWDGTDKKGTLLPPNTYYYVVEVNNELSEAGWVQIVY